MKTKSLNEKSLVAPGMNRDINLHDPTWNYHDTDSIDDLVKASLLFYTQYARELGANSPADPKFLNKLEVQLERKMVPEEVIDKVVFRLRLREKQQAVKKNKMKVSEVRNIVKDVLIEELSRRMVDGALTE